MNRFNENSLNRFNRKWTRIDSNKYAVPSVGGLPCGGCKFCSRMREKWVNFLEKVDYVIPLAVGRIDGEEEDNTEITLLTQKRYSGIAGYRRWGQNNKTLGGSRRETTEGGAHAG